MLRRIGTATLTPLAVGLLTGCIPRVEAPYGPPPPRYDRAPPPQDTPPPTEEPTPDRWQAPVALDTRPPAPRRDGPDRITALPAPRPAWEARSVEADARAVAPSSYTVQRGDTLSAIADRTGAGAEAIAAANALPLPYVVRVGQRLTIPGGRYHFVRSGQTGIAIARAYGVPWRQIIAANGLAEPFVLRAGQRVLIPGIADGQAPSAAERAAAFTLDVDEILTGGEPALASNEAPARPVATASRVLPPTAAVVAPPTALRSGFLWPVDGRIVRRFGPGGSGERSDGIKIATPVGTPIRATADGTVAYVGDGIAALGGLVIVKHGGGWSSVYGHASKLIVQRGQAVKRGQPLALSGDTGFADRPEVHFELRRGRTPVDPQTLLGKR